MGLGRDGGMAEYMTVLARNLVPLGNTDLIAPLANAALTPYHDPGCHASSERRRKARSGHWPGRTGPDRHSDSSRPANMYRDSQIEAEIETYALDNALNTRHKLVDNKLSARAVVVPHTKT